MSATPIWPSWRGLRVDHDRPGPGENERERADQLGARARARPAVIRRSRSAARGRERRARSPWSLPSAPSATHDLRTDAPVQCDAGLVLREDARLDRPDPRGLGGGDERLEQRTADSAAASLVGDIHAVLDDPAVARSGRRRGRRDPADDAPRCRRATNRCSGGARCPSAPSVGTSVSNVALPVGDPLRVDPGHVVPVLGTEGRSRHRTGQVFTSCPLASRPRRLRASRSHPAAAEVAHLPRCSRSRRPASVSFFRWCETVGCARPSDSLNSHAHTGSPALAIAFTIFTLAGSASAPEKLGCRVRFLVGERDGAQRCTADDGLEERGASTRINISKLVNLSITGGRGARASSPRTPRP